MDRPRRITPRRTRSIARQPQAPHRQLARFKRILRQHLPDLRERYGVKSLGLFGSYVHGKPRASSDLDVLGGIRQ